MYNNYSQIEIYSRFQKAAIGIATWHEALNAMASYTGSMRGQLVGIGGPQSIPFNYVTYSCDEALNEFIDINGGSPDINPRVTAGMRANQFEIVGDNEYKNVRNVLKNDDYLDYNKKWDMPFGCQTNLLLKDDLLIGLAVLRSERDGSTNEDTINKFAQMIPIAYNAVNLALLLEHQGAHLITGALEKMTIKAVICDNLGKITAITPNAEEFIIKSNIIDINKKKLRLKNLYLQELLNCAFNKTLKSGNESQILISNNNYGINPIILSINLLPNNEWNFTISPKFIIKINDGNKLPEISELQTIYDLSRIEAEISNLICKGKTRDEIAQIRGVSIDTIRTHLKNIFLKFKVNRESDLIIKALSIK